MMSEINREGFLLYIKETINPRRKECGLAVISTADAEKALVILEDFFTRWNKPQDLLSAVNLCIQPKPESQR
jgi:hypothetical protein